MSGFIGEVGKACIAAALAGFLCGCGGGGSGGGGTGITGTPTPPPSPPPNPPQNSSIAAPARATTDGDLTAIVASPGEVSFLNGVAPGTEFPLLQTAVQWNGSNLEPAFAGTVAPVATVSGNQISIQNAEFVSTGGSELDWTRVGYWSVPTDWFVTLNARGVFVIGYQTREDGFPLSGTATYKGSAEGSAFYPSGGENLETRLSSGSATFTADFGARTVIGGVTGLRTATGAAWNGFSFNSTITTNAFSGTTHVTTTPGGIASLGSSATGTIEGRFFGPGFPEAGAVWTLFDGTRAAIGTLSGKDANSACYGCWDP